MPKKNKDKTKKTVVHNFYWHECGDKSHFDLDIPIEQMPFDVKEGETLFCMVKDFSQVRGHIPDGKVHIVLKRRDSEEREARLKSKLGDGKASAMEWTGRIGWH